MTHGAPEDIEPEDTFLVDGVHLPASEFDKLIDRRLWRVDFEAEIFAGLVVFGAILAVVWLVKG